jgi:putative FmdB family regulatory protein
MSLSHYSVLLSGGCVTMPIYEYQCDQCGKTEEILQKMSDDPVSVCPHCSGPMRKLMSLNAFHLKGSGWYVTDYAGKSKNTDSASSNVNTTSSESSDKKSTANSSAKDA